MRALPRAARALGWTLLGLAAAAGVALSAAVLVASSPAGRPIVARAIIRRLDEAVAGSLQLDGVAVLPRGGVELHGLRVYAPSGQRVLSVAKARVFVDVTGLRDRTVGLALELDGPDVDLSREPDGTLAIARAFEPARAAPPEPPGAAAAGPDWTLRLTSLVVKDGSVRWPREGAADVDARGVDVRLAGEYGPRGGFVDGRLRGRLDAPMAAPVALEVSATLDGPRLSVPVLTARVGDDALDLVGVADLAHRTGRAALRLGLARGGAAALVPQGVDLGAVRASAYAESDGRVLTVAAHAAPGDGVEGRADVAVAVHVDPGARAAGFDVSADRLDPSRIVSFAPRGEVTVSARGAASGTGLDDLRGRLDVDLARSTLGGGEVGPARVVASARGGAIQVTSLDASAPGLRARGALSWRPTGAIGGDVTLDVADLARAARNVARFAGVAPPAVSGRGRAVVALSGTTAAPAARATLAAPALGAGGLSLAGVRVDADLSGSLQAPAARVDASAARAAIGDTEASAVLVRATLADGEGRILASASVPRLGEDPVSLEARGRAGPGRRTVELSELVLGYPGTRFALVRPAVLTLAGPSVDRLELAAGPQRLGVEGGIVHGAIEARLWAAHLDLAGLPRGFLPEGTGLAGDLSLEARATGTARRPSVAGSLTLAGASFRGLDGLQALGNFRWSAADRRIAGDVGVVRAAGGSIEVSADLPTSFGAARAAEPVAASVQAEALPAAEILDALGATLPADGRVGLAATLAGTVGAPALRATAEVQDGAWDDLDGLAIRIDVADPGDRARAELAVDRDGAPLARADAEVPLDVATLLARTAATARSLRTAPLVAHASVPGADLSRVAGLLGLPERLAGRLEAAVELGGTIAAPRGRATASLAQGTIGGWTDVDATAAADLSASRTEISASASLAGARALEASAVLGAPVERLAAAGGLGRAPLQARVVIPRIDVARAAGTALPLAGTVEAQATVAGTLARPEIDARADGADLAVRGKPLGAVRATARYAAGSASAELSLQGAAGGTLRAVASLRADLGLGAPPVRLADAPATARVTATGLDLGIVPALAPGVVRTASGVVSLDLAASGPLGTLRPRGSVRLADGRFAVTEYGEWTGVTLDATLGDDDIVVTRLAGRRGAGTLEASGSVRGLETGTGRIEAHATAHRLSVLHAGMELATFDLQADATGTVKGRTIDATVTIPKGTVRLPKQTPRALQSIEPRPDIVVGPVPRRKARAAASSFASSAAPGAPPFEAKLHLVAPGHLLVKSDSPRVDIDLKADTTFELQGGDVYATGSVEVVRGAVEPIDGRNFEIDRGRVQFTGGPPRAAVLDVQATYVNPQATVHVVISGPATAPEIRLSSQPPMDDATIALLIATGRTELKAGSGGVGAATGEDAGKAVLGALATQAFKSLIADKLPVDSVSVDASALRAGKYIGNKFYVGYSRNFDAQPQLGQNQNEVRIEYQISPRWTFQSSYGDALSGSASLIWQRDY